MMRRLLAALLAALLMLATTAPALAQERDLPTDRTTDVAVTDTVPVDTVSDAATDRPTDRCHQTDIPNDRCPTIDRPHDGVSYRALIIRLIKAHEWQKLLRLLHFLGAI